MKVVILAAGMGSRLGDSYLPKPLTTLINGKSILEFQIEEISHVASLNSVYVVVGYQKELILTRFSKINYIYNLEYSHENTSKSLLRALADVDEDLLWMNGDVVFHPSVLDAIVNSDDSAMIVNAGPVADEEVKYRTDGHQRILEVSKEVKGSEGEALGINLFKVRDLPILKKCLSRCDDQDYFEKGIQWSIEEGVYVRAVPIASSLCTEIDFPEDLERANKMIESWG